jgi:hypothetical protein
MEKIGSARVQRRAAGFTDRGEILHEGYGLQPVHNHCKNKPASAAEGRASDWIRCPQGLTLAAASQAVPFTNVSFLSTCFLAGDGFFFAGGGGGFFLALYLGPASTLRIGDGATGFGAELAAWFVGGNLGGGAARLISTCEDGADLAEFRDFFINGLQNLVVQGCSFRG